MGLKDANVGTLLEQSITTCRYFVVVLLLTFDNKTFLRNPQKNRIKSSNRIVVLFDESKQQCDTLTQSIWNGCCCPNSPC